jgi:hypothetical protein
MTTLLKELSSKSEIVDARREGAKRAPILLQARARAPNVAGGKWRKSVGRDLQDEQDLRGGRNKGEEEKKGTGEGPSAAESRAQQPLLPIPPYPFNPVSPVNPV